jgi:hypothetical protein
MWLIYLLALPALCSPTKGPGAGTLAASSSTQIEPRITCPPAVKTLEVRNGNQGQNFVGYYYLDGSCLLTPATVVLALWLLLIARRCLEATC